MLRPEAARPSLTVVEGETYADWESVYSQNVVLVYRLIYRQVGSRADAEDLTEEVFLAALPRLRLPAARHSVRAYLAATVRTSVAEHWRRHYAAPPTLVLIEDLDAEALAPEVPDEDAGRRARRLL